jgi:putative transcriptional regulator
LVLNRRSTVPLSKVLDLKSAQDRTDPVYLGGPMEPTTAFALYQSQAKIEKAETVFSGVYLISDKDLFEQTISAKPDPKVFRVYLGYAGWTQDQLRAEVKLGAWYVFPADAGSVFASDPDSLWQQMIRNTNLMQARTEAFTPIRSVDNSPRRVPHRWAVQKPLSPRLQARAAATSVMRTTPG